MEERLKRNNTQRAPHPQAQQENQEAYQNQHFQSREATANKEDQKARSRPGTARATQQAPSAGNMPPTPGASEGEHYMASRAG